MLTAVAGPGTVLAQGAGAAAAGGAANVAGSSAAGGAPAFADVPPCHWAAAAVAKVARTGIFVGYPPDPRYLSVNALRQVFEGLKCGDPAWSLRFLTGAPGAFAATGGPTLARFTLNPSIVSLGKTSARLAFKLTAVIDAGGAQRTLVRQGSVTATHTSAGWQVAYADLAALNLPLFPH